MRPVALAVLVCAVGCGDDLNRMLDGDAGGAPPDAAGCVPMTCTQALATCGEVDDGCGGTVTCGPCESPYECGAGGDDTMCALPAELQVCDETTGFCWVNPYPPPLAALRAAPTDDDLRIVGIVGDTVWFASETSVWVWKGGGLIETVPPPGTITSVVGESPHEVLATQDDTLFAFDGRGWTALDAPPSAFRLFRVGGTIYLSANDGLYQRMETGTWPVGGWSFQVLVSPPYEGSGFSRFYDVAGSPGDLWGVGTVFDGCDINSELLVHLEGWRWYRDTTQGLDTLKSVLVRAPDDVWTAGIDQLGDPMLGHWDGESWSWTSQYPNWLSDLVALPGDDMAALVYGNGSPSAVYRRTDGTWASWLEHPQPDGFFLSLEADAAGGLWLSGSEGAILHRPPP